MGEIKQKIDIERLLSWAYREELPKKELAVTADSTSWDSVDRYLGRGGVEIDRDPWELHLQSQRYAGIGKPHADARDLACLVDGLDDVTIQWPAAKNILLGPLAPYLTPDSEFLIRKLRAQSSGLVRAHARMGTRPMWDIYWKLGPVVLKNQHTLVQYVDRHGKVVDCTSGQRDYIRGGRCPLKLTLHARPGERDPLANKVPLAEIVSARFEYFVWHSALREIVRQVKGSWKLEDHEPTGPLAAQAPWLTGAERKGRILPALQETGNQQSQSRATEVVGS